MFEGVNLFMTWPDEVLSGPVADMMPLVSFFIILFIAGVEMFLMYQMIKGALVLSQGDDDGARAQGKKKMIFSAIAVLFVLAIVSLIPLIGMIIGEVIGANA